MAEHTPGPWKWASRKGGWDGVDAVGGENICHLEFNNPENARLIAAAPDLLEAAQRVLDGGYVSKHIAEERDDYLFLVAAIAKATGSQS